MKMKTLLAVMICLAMLLTVGCSKKQTAGEESTASSSAESTGTASSGGEAADPTGTGSAAATTDGSEVDTPIDDDEGEGDPYDGMTTVAPTTGEQNPEGDPGVDGSNTGTVTGTNTGTNNGGSTTMIPDIDVSEEETGPAATTPGQEATTAPTEKEDDDFVVNFDDLV